MPFVSQPPLSYLPEQESKSFLINHPADFLFDWLPKVVSHSSVWSSGELGERPELSGVTAANQKKTQTGQNESNSGVLNRLAHQYKQEAKWRQHLLPQLHFPPWTGTATPLEGRDGSGQTWVVSHLREPQAKDNYSFMDVKGGRSMN